jgi:hypothetical protein
MTTPIQGLERYEEMLEALGRGEGTIKVYVEVAGARRGSRRPERATAAAGARPRETRRPTP